MEWKLAEAKNRFSELVNKALVEGPQRVSRREERVVVISENEYQLLTGQKPDFIEFLLEGALDLDGVDFEREKSHSRKVDL
jgi:prevent-host-death family protein